MLARQNLGGGHQRGLPARAHGHHGRQRGDHRLATAHVPLQQPVHRLGTGQIGGDFVAHSLLGAGQRKGQRGQQLLLATAIAQGFAPLAGPQRPCPLQRQLLRHQLFQNHPLAGRRLTLEQRLQIGARWGMVNLAQRIRQ